MALINVGSPDAESGANRMEIKTIKEQAYDIILKKILTREYPLGGRINITSLSQELGISNSPIREALNQLEQQGLVVTTRNSGINIVSLSKLDMYEICQVMLFWEIGAYDFCYTMGDTEKMCKKMEATLKLQKNTSRNITPMSLRIKPTCLTAA